MHENTISKELMLLLNGNIINKSPFTLPYSEHRHANRTYSDSIYRLQIVFHKFGRFFVHYTSLLLCIFVLDI